MSIINIMGGCFIGSMGLGIGILITYFLYDVWTDSPIQSRLAKLGLTMVLVPMAVSLVVLIGALAIEAFTWRGAW